MGFLAFSIKNHTDSSHPEVPFIETSQHYRHNHALLLAASAHCRFANGVTGIPSAISALILGFLNEPDMYPISRSIQNFLYALSDVSGTSIDRN